MDPGAPPGPGWTMGDDGHWKPPPLTTGGPSSAPAPQAPGSAVPPWPPQPPGPPGQPGVAWPPPGTQSSTRSAGVVVAFVLGAFALVAVVCIAAVTMLGTTKDQDHFESLPGTITTTTAADGADPTTDPSGEPSQEPSGDDARIASAAIVDHMSSDEWKLTSNEPLPLESTDSCTPAGWNGGAVNRHSSVYERTDGELTINVTVYGDASDAAADRERVGGSEWLACHREDIYDAYGDANPRFEPLAEDPQAPGVAYLEHFVSDGRRSLDTVHYVFVGQIRATITYCGCATVGLEGRREVARDVAAALAEVQGLPAPGRDGT